MKLVLVVGHSHIRALHDAQAAYPDACRGIEFAFAPLNGPAFSPALENGVLHRGILALLGARRLVAVVATLSGNRHNVLGLARHPRPYDTVLPEASDLPLTDGAEVLPFALIRQTLLRRSGDVEALLSALRAATDRPLFHVESPPPIPSEAHLRAHPRGFAELFAECGIAPAALRYKLWRANSQMMDALCARHGATSLPVPPQMRDAEGMLAPEGWPDDPTHANAAYGAAVLAQIAEAVAPLQPDPARLRQPPARRRMHGTSP